MAKPVIHKQTQNGETYCLRRTDDLGRRVESSYYWWNVNCYLCVQFKPEGGKGPGAARQRAFLAAWRRRVLATAAGQPGGLQPIPPEPPAQPSTIHKKTGRGEVYCMGPATPGISWRPASPPGPFPPCAYRWSEVSCIPCLTFRDPGRQRQFFIDRREQHRARAAAPQTAPPVVVAMPVGPRPLPVDFEPGRRKLKL